MRVTKMLAGAALIAALATPAAAQSLEGVWQGAYWGGGNQPTTFQATIADPAGPGFSGTMLETNTFSADQVAFLLSTFDGVAQGENVSFIKTYDGTGGAVHSVTYQGRIDSPRRIVGTWSLGETTGQFELVR
jgi:hypothetical protein